MKVNSLTEWLFHYLSKEENESRFSTSNISIPNTLIYRYSNPYFWYFEQNGILKKKKRDRFSQQEFFDEISKSKEEESIVAQYMYSIRQEGALQESLGIDYFDVMSLGKDSYERRYFHLLRTH